ncbi:hypothetical protein D9M73_245050 [compost metagenome]
MLRSPAETFSQYGRACGQGLGQQTFTPLEQIIGKVPGGGCTSAEAEEIEHQVLDFHTGIYATESAQLFKNQRGALLDTSQHTRAPPTRRLTV